MNTTPKQMDFIISLGKELRELAGDDDDRNTAVNALGAVAKGAQMGKLSVPQSSEFIDALIAQRDEWRRTRSHSPQNGEPKASDPDPGMYRGEDGTIYRVYLGQKSGYMLVKQLVGNDTTGYEYSYLGRAAYRLPADAKPLPLEEAKAFGRMTGTCCVCARRLDNPESVDAGIGPVCAGRMEGGFTR